MGLGYATSNRGGCHLNGGYLVLMEAVGIMSIGAQRTKGKAELTVYMQNMTEAVSAAGFCLFTTQTMIPKDLFKFGPNSIVTKMAGKSMAASSGMINWVTKNTPKSMPFNSMSMLPHVDAIQYATGLSMTTGEFLEIGERGYNIERLYNLREGLTSSDDTLPDRLTKTPQIKGDLDSVVKIDKMMPIYYEARGWDNEGVPTDEILKKLKVF